MVRGNFNPGHDPDRVLADVTMVLADGGEAIADIDVLRHQARGSARWRRRPQFLADVEAGHPGGFFGGAKGIRSPTRLRRAGGTPT